MDKTIQSIVLLRDEYEKHSLVMQSQLDQLPLLSLGTRVYDIIVQTIVAVSKVVEPPNNDNTTEAAGVVAKEVVSLISQRMRIGIPSLHIVNEITEFVRDEMLQRFELDLSEMSIHTARANEALRITQFISEFNGKRESIKALLRTVALAARNGKPAFIDEIDVLQLAFNIYRRLKLVRENARHVSVSAIEKTVSIVWLLEKERFSFVHFAIVQV